MHAWTLYVREPGDLHSLWPILARAVGEGLWPQARREHYGEVRHRHITQEGAEQCRDAADALEGRPVTEGNSVKTDCDLHAEAGVSIERA